MNHKHLMIAALLCGIAVPAAAQTVQSGIAAWQKSDYDTAVKIWRPLAEQGDPDAQFNLAQAYRLGRGVPTNVGAAQIWLERAAVQGHLDAQTTLGLLLFQNGNRTEAIKWLKAAAEKNDPRAMLVYGTALFNGDTVTQNAPLGYSYVSRAATQGLAPAKATLTQMDQVMSPADKKKALALVAADRASAKPAEKPESAKAEPAKSKPAHTEVAVAEVKPTPPQSRVAGKPSAAKTQSGDTAAVAKPVEEKPAAKPVEDKVAAEKPPAKPVPEKPRVAEKAEPVQKRVTAPPAPQKGSWRIQLGAFSQRGSAEALFRKLSGSAPVAGHSASYSAAGAVTRLQVGPFASKAAADEACRTLSARAQPCFPVPGK